MRWARYVTRMGERKKKGTEHFGWKIIF